jgi:tRNA dimethylallyltransferase
VPDVVALVGPTATGKSVVALDLAARVGAEIVAVDAFTVYRGMDIGTAKPSPEDRRRVPHHLVDVLDPEQDCTVRWFQPAARRAIADVLARGRTALLVGGSGLYFRAAVDPLEFPPTDPAVRAAVEAAAGDDPPAAHARLAAADPAAAALIEPGNLRRTVRALEVIQLTGRPFSAWRTAWDDYRPVYPGLRVYGLDRPREELVARIGQRVDGMMAAGLLEECRALHGRPLSATAAQAIGYAELLGHLDGRTTLDEAVEATKARTRRFAARQRRWFRGDPRVRWTDSTTIVREVCAD